MLVFSSIRTQLADERRKREGWRKGENEEEGEEKEGRGEGKSSSDRRNSCLIIR